MKTKILLVSFLILFPIIALAAADSEPKQVVPKEVPPISGKVLEVIHSSSYTYLLLQDADGFKDWVAIPEMYVEIGDDVELLPGTQMGKFKSKGLEKTFDRIIFSAGPTAKFNEKRKENAHKAADMSAPAPGKNKSGGTIVPGLKVEKAKGDNAYTIAELFAKRDELQDKIVAVSGQVVKVSSGIMDRNWVHIMDGTGPNGENKLVVTTKSEPSAGTIVTVTGTFHNNVDFGGGYQYAVIVENAEIK